MTQYTLEALYGLKEQVVVISGGTRGIGRELANACIDLGARVAVIGSSAQGCADAQNALCTRGGEALGVAADVTDEQAVDAAFAQIAAHFGRIDALVNCAGINHIEPLHTLDMADFNRVIDVNFTGTVHCCKAAGTYMLPAEKGRIVNISSLSALQGKSFYTAYSASKAAMHGFTRSLATEWARQGINVNVVAPGLIVTDINRAQVQANPQSFQKRIESIPRGVAGRLEWLVSPVVMLLSPGAAHVTGQVLYVDGGLSTGDTFVMQRE